MGNFATIQKPYYGLMDIMKRQGVTQNDLSAFLGMDRSTFNLKINRGRDRDFTLSEAVKISEKLGRPLDDFF